MTNFAAGLFSIVLINLLLSGDNALVIGMAVRGLVGAQKRRAVLIGGAGALILRVVLTTLAAVLLQIPLLEAGGGLLLAGLTYRLLASGAENGPAARAEELGFAAALRTIIIADLTMSLDNVLAVGAAAQGDVLLLVLGLGISMAIIMAGGSVVALLLERLPWLVYAGAVILLLVAGDLMAKDPVLTGLIGQAGWLSWALAGALGLLVGGALVLRRTRPPVAADRGPTESDILNV